MAIDKYVKDLQELSALREEREKLDEKAAIVEQVLTMSAVSQSATFSTTPDLVTAMLKEASKLRKELGDNVREVLILKERVYITITQSYRANLYQTWRRLLERHLTRVKGPLSRPWMQH